MPLSLSGNGLITGFNPVTSGFGKVLQVVRATDTTARSTTSTTFVDITGMSVTITPQKSTSAIILVFNWRAVAEGQGSNFTLAQFRITDASNNPISGSEQMTLYTLGYSASGSIQLGSPLTLIAYSTPATTSATTYKLQASTSGLGSLTVKLENNTNTAQLFAIEVAA